MDKNRILYSIKDTEQLQAWAQICREAESMLCRMCLASKVRSLCLNSQPNTDGIIEWPSWCKVLLINTRFRNNLTRCIGQSPTLVPYSQVPQLKSKCPADQLIKLTTKVLKSSNNQLCKALHPILLAHLASLVNAERQVLTEFIKINSKQKFVSSHKTLQSAATMNWSPRNAKTRLRKRTTSWQKK